MNDQSPPKRVTRARAAAKTTDNDVKTTKIATAASKAKVTRAASTTKRKTRGDETNEGEQSEPKEIIEPEQPKTTRGRGRKAVTQPEPEMEKEQVEAAPAPVKTRGRPKKAAIETAPPAPTRSLRGRAKAPEASNEPEEAIIVDEPPKKPTRARAGTVPKATAPKKSVKFEEPDKENIVPAPVNVKGKAKAVETGLKAKPVRKPMPTAATRATRGRAKVEEQNAQPLSPKKATQVAVAKDHSEDELATNEKTPMKPLMRSPIKAPGSIFGTAKRLDFSNSITVNRAITQDLGASIMGSPARRPPQSPFKEAMKTSPQRQRFGDSMLKSPFKFSVLAQRTTDEASSPFKASMLQSPARRPQSPVKIADNGSPTRGQAPTFGVTPKASIFKISRFATPRTVTKSAVRPGQMLLPANLSTGSPVSKNESQMPEVMGEDGTQFSGRLSSILPREADPSISDPSIMTSEPTPEEEVDQVMADEPVDDDTIDEDTIVVEDPKDERASTPPASPPQVDNNAFALREADENPFYDSDSEDELASASSRYSPVQLTRFGTSTHDFAAVPLTPGHFTAISKTPRTTVSRKSGFAPSDQLGFTPLARQLSDWMAASPVKSEEPLEEEQPVEGEVEENNTTAEAVTEPSPVKNTFFEEEMSLRDEIQREPIAPTLIMDDIHFDPLVLDEEDISLAQEADELSLLEPEIIQEMQQAQDTEEENVEINELTFHDLIITESEQIEVQVVYEPIDEAASSEASQEYGDENAVPIDPALLEMPAAPATPKHSTPKRVLAERVFHTVSKVPLKPAADDTPMRPSPMKRSASISRLPTQRPSSNLSRSNTVISYSPSKRTTRAQSPVKDVEMQDAYETPSKPETDIWSAIATPARTPRHDLNTGLLKGAVVFVDVHTTEGADASTLFTELLTQMGARCVKRWDWNGNSEEGKVGITHVVFKDGGKRTLEKVRETGGVVSCVGVGWVLDCERENEWLSESPYSIDTSLVPRGGHRRRKSMEPRALTNMNGTLLPSATPIRPSRRTMSPTKQNFIQPETPFTAKVSRRESVQWVRSPSTASPDDQIDDATQMLSPIPATPAPETIASYGEDGLYGDDTPSAQTPYFFKKEMLIQKTAPPGKRYFDSESGSGFLPEKKDESVMLRLMAARRKSLQFAPKIGSPLARGGEAW